MVIEQRCHIVASIRDFLKDEILAAMIIIFWNGIGIAVLTKRSDETCAGIRLFPHSCWCGADPAEGIVWRARNDAINALRQSPDYLAAICQVKRYVSPDVFDPR